MCPISERFYRGAPWKLLWRLFFVVQWLTVPLVSVCQVRQRQVSGQFSSQTLQHCSTDWLVPARCDYDRWVGDFCLRLCSRRSPMFEPVTWHDLRHGDARHWVRLESSLHQLLNLGTQLIFLRTRKRPAFLHIKWFEWMSSGKSISNEKPTFAHVNKALHPSGVDALRPASCVIAIVQWWALVFVSQCCRNSHVTWINK